MSLSQQQFKGVGNSKEFPVTRKSEKLQSCCWMQHALPPEAISKKQPEPVSQSQVNSFHFVRACSFHAMLLNTHHVTHNLTFTKKPGHYPVQLHIIQPNCFTSIINYEFLKSLFWHTSRILYHPITLPGDNILSLAFVSNSRSINCQKCKTQLFLVIHFFK